MKANADTPELLKEQLRIAERMVDSIYHLSAGDSPPDPKMLVYLSVRAKAALGHAKTLIESDGPDAVRQEEG